MNEENIIKIEKTGNYSVIANECFKNLNLSARAKGIYGYIMTLPLNWKLYKSELYNHFTEGRDALNTAFKELEDFGYITKIQNKREDGTFLSYQYTIYESCQTTKNPQAGVPQTEKPLAGNPSLETVPSSCINTYKQNTNSINNSVVDKPTVYSFKDFWNEYDKKIGIQVCQKKFDKLSEEDREIIKNTVKEFIKSTPDKQFRPNPETYLNNKKWNDEIIFKSSLDLFGNSKYNIDSEVEAMKKRKELYNE